MKAIIAIFFSFTLLWTALFINASELELNENTKIVTGNLKNVIITQDVMCTITFLFQSCPQKILSTILNEFLTIHEILILRKTCINFSILLFPNDKNMTIFCKDFGSKEMDNVPLMWSDLKYFLNHSYANALNDMVMLNLKQDQYAVFTRDKKIISWHNQQVLDLYRKLIFNQITNQIISSSQFPLHYEPLKIYNKCNKAWAKINAKDGNIITGGVGKYGNDFQYHIQFQLKKNVQTIVTSYSLFAALLDNGNVISWEWGKTILGGKSHELIHQTQFHKVKMIASTNFAFALLLHHGGIIAWGHKSYGGEISEYIQTQLKNQNVKMIFSNDYAFATLLEDGSVIAWGREYFGGKVPEQIQHKKLISSSLLQQQIKVKMIFCNIFAFAALLDDGSVVAWGRENYGGKIPESIQPHLKKVKTIFSTRFTFAALLQDGSVYSWGGISGNIVPHILHQKVKTIFSNDYAFVALLDNDHFIAWGDESNGGKISDEIQTQLKNVKVLFSSSCAFAFLLEDGSVFTWGNPRGGGKIPEEVQSKLMKNVKLIFPQRKGFTALCSNGEMITWGEY